MSAAKVVPLWEVHFIKVNIDPKSDKPDVIGSHKIRNDTFLGAEEAIVGLYDLRSTKLEQVIIMSSNLIKE